MYIKKVKEMPTEGQFIVAWTYEGAAWSGMFAYGPNGLQDLDTGEVADRVTHDWLHEDNKDYFIAQEYKNANK